MQVGGKNPRSRPFAHAPLCLSPGRGTSHSVLTIQGAPCCDHACPQGAMGLGVLDAFSSPAELLDYLY